MVQRFVLFETGSAPEIFKVPLNRIAQLRNLYPDRNLEVFETLREATVAALAMIARAEVQSRARISVFATAPLPESDALRKRFNELTEDRVETFIP